MARCPGPVPDVREFTLSPDVREVPRISGTSAIQRASVFTRYGPDVRHTAGCPGPRISEPLAGFPTHTMPEPWWSDSVACRMSGHKPDVRALPYVPDVRDFPGCPAPLFPSLALCIVCSLHRCRMSGPWPGCPARLCHLHYNGHICTHTINTSSPLHGEVDHSLCANPRTHISLSHILIHQIQDPKSI